jgi:hypothetical protein
MQMSALPVAGLRLEFCAGPGEFLASAGDFLAADPVVSTVVTTVADRLLAQQGDEIAQPGRTWWLVVRNASAVVGAGMRTAPFAPYPPFLLPMPDQAAVALARTLHERGEEVLSLNGARPAVDLCAAELTRLGGGRVQVSQHTRLHELGELVWPAAVPGGLQAATEDDVELVTEWFGAFMGDADEQAGRPRGASADEAPDRTEMLRRWASNAVAGISRRIQAEGARVCLFTDQANPTSNKIYAALGYQPVADMANLVIAL